MANSFMLPQKKSLYTAGPIAIVAAAVIVVVGVLLVAIAVVVSVGTRYWRGFFSHSFQDTNE